jgi:tRNA-modifying protein YgfZ
MSLWNVGKRSVLRIHGSDAVRYLNGQITQDAQLPVTQRDRAFATCVTDAKGRLQAYGSIFSPDGISLFLEAPWDLREALLARIERYLIADDAEIEDVSDSWVLLHEVMEPSSESGVAALMSFHFARLGVAGMDHWLAADALLPDCEMSLMDAESIRITNGEPCWGMELQEGLLPPEAGLEARSISYNKGCYIGQEVISRMKTAGKVNRKLARLVIDDCDLHAPSLVGENLFCGETVVGTISSHAGKHAIAWLKKSGFQETQFSLGSGVVLRCVE